MGNAILANVRAVFFDAVGTLLFPEPSAVECYRTAAARRGLNLSPDELQRRFLAAYQLEEAADRLAGWVTDEQREVARWRRIIGSTLEKVDDPEECFHELFDHFARPAAWRVDPDAQRVAATLNDRGLILGIGSNYDSRLWSVLCGFPELSLLRDRVVISSAVGYRKPAGAFFREVAGCTEREPGEILFVGDDFENDYEGARAAGLRGVLIDPLGNESRTLDRISSLRRLLD